MRETGRTGVFIQQQTCALRWCVAACLAIAINASVWSGPPPEPCIGDVNGDFEVNVLDLLDLLLCFGQPAVPGCEAADIVNDGTVNVLDLIELLLHFGEICPKPPQLCEPGPGAPANDCCADRLAIGDGTTPFTTVGADTDGVAHVECKFTGQTYNDVWFSYTATCDGNLTVSLCNLADYDTSLGVYDGCDCTNLQLHGCNDDTLFCNFTSEVVVPVVAGNCYKIRIGGFAPTEDGSGDVLVQCDP